MQEIMEAKARRLSSMLIQRSWRAYKGRCRFQVLKFRTRHSITCRVARGFLGRRRALREKKMLKVALRFSACGEEGEPSLTARGAVSP